MKNHKLFILPLVALSVLSCGTHQGDTEGETQMIQEFWLAAVDHNFEEVSIMRGIDKRSDFFRSLGPEYDDMDKAFSAFRQECCGRG